MAWVSRDVHRVSYRWFAGCTENGDGGERGATSSGASACVGLWAELLACTAGGDRLKFSMEGWERAGGSADSKRAFSTTPIESNGVTVVFFFSFSHLAGVEMFFKK